jgi:hypothetical protein
MTPRNLSPTELVPKVVAELMPLANMLSPHDRRIIRRFCDYILQNRVSVSEAVSLLPLEAALVIIQVEEHKKNHHEFARLYDEIQELRVEIERLTAAE